MDKKFERWTKWFSSSMSIKVLCLPAIGVGFSIISQYYYHQYQDIERTNVYCWSKLKGYRSCCATDKELDANITNKSPCVCDNVEITNVEHVLKSVYWYYLEEGDPRPFGQLCNQALLEMQEKENVNHARVVVICQSETDAPKVKVFSSYELSVKCPDKRFAWFGNQEQKILCYLQECSQNNKFEIYSQNQSEIMQ